MNRRTTLMLTGMTLFGLTLAATSAALADETLKSRAIMHLLSVQTQDIGDVDGHTASLGRYSGLVSFPDGSIATTYVIFTTDYVKGSGQVTLNYQNITFNDGSVLWLKGTGTTTVEGTKSLIQTSGTILGGKGRYEGAKGDYTTTGARISPLASGADLYADAVINVKK
jgi:hypothetical protein